MPEPSGSLDSPERLGEGQTTTVSTLLLFFLNLFLAILWPILNGAYTLSNLAIGFVGGLFLIALAERRYGRLAYYGTEFVLYTLWQILISNLRVAWLLLRGQRIYPGIVDVPLTITSDFEIVLLASVITLTPGTLSVDLGRNRRGEQVLYVHNLKIEGREAFQESIKSGFERRILRLSRGGGNDV